MRISSYPYGELCPSFAATPEQAVDTPNEAGLMGSAVHAGMHRIGLGRDPNVDGLAAVFGVDRDELDGLLEYGAYRWEELAAIMPNPMFEHYMSAGGRSGHTDAISVSDAAIIIPDWKSGWRTDPVRSEMQVLGYLCVARETYGRRPRYLGLLEDLRNRSTTRYDVTDDDLDAWDERAKRIEADAGRVFSPGKPCGFCPQSHTCSARRRWMQQGALAMSAPTAMTVTNASEALVRIHIAELWPAYKAAKAAVQAFEGAAKAAIISGGAIQINPSMAIVMEPSTRDKIDTAKAWPVLKAHGISGNDVAPALSIAKGKLLDVYGAQFGRGMKGKAKGKLTQALREAGAITTTTSLTLAEVDNSHGGSL